ncbi:peptidylprolyl isomerase [Leeia sp.]|uniref:peptidylprolyl isomerase n=1 Tax=Leeia sp. TaxID=2884678 RepID=UPI0035B40C44
MRKTVLALALAAGVATLAHAAGFKVNGVMVPEARMEAMVKEMVKRGQPDTPELRAQVKDNLILVEAMAQRGAAAGLDKDANYQTQVELTRLNLLANAYVTDYMAKNPVSDAVLKAEYDKIKPDLDKEAAAAGAQYKARHILVKDEKTAKSLLAELKKGGNFAELAKKNSIDTGSAQNGGLLDYAAPGNYVKPFADALVKLKKGQYSQEPVKTQYGFHLILVEDIQAAKAPTLEEVKPQLQQQLQQQQLQNLLDEVKKSAKVE